MLYGQVVLGPPGSGKSTYCYALQQYFKIIDRKCIVVNLDPANDNIQYKCDINITELVTLTDVMEEYELGPNGSLLFCMEFLLKNINWLFERLKDYPDHYVLFDFAGQVELFTSNTNVNAIIKELEKHGFRLVAVNLVDSFYCSNPEIFISASLTSLITMINLELPAVNILSKIDLISKYGDVDYDLDFYTSLPEVTRLLFGVDRHSGPLQSENGSVSSELDVAHSEDSEDSEDGEDGEEVCEEEEFVRRAKNPFRQKYRRLYWMLCELVDDYSLLSYLPLDVNSPTSIRKVVEMTDKANGFSLLSYLDGGGLMNVYAKNDTEMGEVIEEMNDKYVLHDDDWI